MEDRDVSHLPLGKQIAYQQLCETVASCRKNIQTAKRKRLEHLRDAEGCETTIAKEEANIGQHHKEMEKLLTEAEAAEVASDEV